MADLPGWPATLRHDAVELRPLRRRDRQAWIDVRNANEAWLRPWEATSPGGNRSAWSDRHTAATYADLLRGQRQQARAGSHYPYGIFVDSVLRGQIGLGEVVRGAFFSGYVGYWVDGSVAGRGIATTALALLADHAFGVLGLHRVEANIRPDNAASLAVVKKLGFIEEGLHRRYLAIDGDWRDHLTFALLAEDSPNGVLCRLRGRQV